MSIDNGNQDNQDGKPEKDVLEKLPAASVDPSWSIRMEYLLRMTIQLLHSAGYSPNDLATLRKEQIAHLLSIDQNGMARFFSEDVEV